MNDSPQLTDRLCCMVQPYFTCEACKDVFCQMHLYSWVASRNHPIPSNKECAENNAYWKCDTAGKFLSREGNVI